VLNELGHEQPKTTKELLDIAPQHASSEEVVGAAFILGNAGATTNNCRPHPTKAAIKGAKKGSKGSRKGQKHRPHCIVVMAGNSDSDEEAGDSSEEFMAAIERNFKR
jgi:hypothetical protein